VLRRILLTTDAVGGIWRYSIELARGLADRRVKVVLAVLGPRPTVFQHREVFASPGVTLVVTGLPLDWLAETETEIESAAQALAALAGEVCADTVQLHAPALVGHANWPAPVVAVAHSCVGTWWSAVHGGVLPPDLAWRSRATAVGTERANYLLAPSRSFADALRAYYPSSRPIEVVLNGRARMLGHGPRRAHALTAGRLWDEGKNVAAMDAAARVLHRPVYAAGPLCGPNGARLTCSHLQMLGPLNEAALADEYARAAVFVSTALYEPFGLAVLEAAQGGCALLLSDIPTFRELWQDVAIFIPPRDPDRIAYELDRLLRDPPLRDERGAAALQHSKAFSSHRMADAIWNIHAGAAA
jgi:glycosyltransferase involved in cell wall biosynthesis